MPGGTLTAARRHAALVEDEEACGLVVDRGYLDPALARMRRGISAKWIDHAAENQVGPHFYIWWGYEEFPDVSWRGADRDKAVRALTGIADWHSRPAGDAGAETAGASVPASLSRSAATPADDAVSPTDNAASAASLPIPGEAATSSVLR
jgi:hypothetical protein